MATIVAASGGGSWNTGATWVGGIVPGVNDDVQLTSSSGSVTAATNSCRSLDCTGYTGTFTVTASLTIGGGSTAGLSNIAMKLSAGMTISAAVVITFASTSATQQTVTTAGKTLASLAFTGVGGSWQLQDALTMTGNLTHTGGTLDTNGQTVSAALFSSTGASTRVLTLGASSLTFSSTTVPWTISGSGITLNANTSTINVSSAASTIFAAATGMTYNNLVYTTAITGSTSITGNATFNNITVSAGATKTAQFTFAGSGTTTVNGTLTINGNSATNRLLIKSNVPGTPVTLSCAAVSFSHVDFMDIVGTGAASWNLSAITGLSGDCGGNSGITFTTAATQTCATATPAGTWSGLAWSGRVPLPQDDAVVSISGNAKSIQLDMSRSGHNIDFSGTTGTGLSIYLGQSTSWFGDINLTNVATFLVGSGLTLAGRGVHTIRSGGLTWGPALTINTASSYKLLDNMIAGTQTFGLTGGTFDLNGFDALFNAQIAAGTRDWTISLGGGTLQGATLVSNAAIARSLNMGTGGTIKLTSTASGTFFQFSSGSLTTTGTGTIQIGAASANARTFDGGSFSYPKLQYTVNGSTGSLTIAGSNTFSDIEFKDTTNARSLLFPTGTTTVTGTFDVQGTSGKLMTIDTSAAATHTLSKASGTVACDFLSVKNSTATGGASWYAGANSTNVSGNTGWIFSAAPAIVTFTQTAHARIANTRTKTQTSNSRIANTRTKLQTAIAKMANSRIATQLAHSRIANTRTKLQTATSRIANTKTKLQTAIARIAIVKSATQTVRARIAVIRSLTQLVHARIATTRTKAQTATARIVPASIRAKTQNTTSRIANTRNKVQTATAKITNGGVVKTKVQTVHARISNILTKVQTSNAKIAKTVTKIQTVHARIGVPKTKTQTAKAWFSKGFTKIQTARARIGFQVSKRQTARARISNNLLTQQKANARIIQNRYKFQTPVGLGFMRGKRGFWHHMRPQASGITVLKENGYYREVVYPSQREISAAEIAYMGGHDHYVTQSEAAELVAAGYNVEVITHE